MFDFIAVELFCRSEVGSLLWVLRWPGSDLHRQIGGVGEKICRYEGFWRQVRSLCKKKIFPLSQGSFDLGIWSTGQTFRESTSLLSLLQVSLHVKSLFSDF